MCCRTKIVREKGIGDLPSTSNAQREWVLLCIVCQYCNDTSYLMSAELKKITVSLLVVGEGFRSSAGSCGSSSIFSVFSELRLNNAGTQSQTQRLGNIGCLKSARLTDLPVGYQQRKKRRRCIGGSSKNPTAPITSITSTWIRAENPFAPTM